MFGRDASFDNYPKGKIAIGSGDLHDAYSISLQYSDGERSVPTIRRAAAGTTGGGRSVTLTFRSYISDLGFERNYMRNYRERQEIQVRIKVPFTKGELTSDAARAERIRSGTPVEITVIGKLSEPEILSQVDGAVEFAVKVVGRDPSDPGRRRT